LMGLARPTSDSGTILGKDIVRDNVDIRANVDYLPQDAFLKKEGSAATLIGTIRNVYDLLAAEKWFD